MARKVSVSAADQKGKEGKAFGPLPAGPRLFNIFDIKQEEYNNGGNKGRPQLNIHFQVAAGEDRANARHFERIGDFPRWAPNAKNPDGAVNFLYFQLYEALGVEFPKDGGDVELPDIEDMIGEQVVLDLKIEPDDYRFRKAYSEWEAEKEKYVAKAVKKGKDESEAEDEFEEKIPGPDRNSDEFKRNAVKSIKTAEDYEPADADDAEAGSDEFDL